MRTTTFSVTMMTERMRQRDPVLPPTQKDPSGAMLAGPEHAWVGTPC